MTVRSMCRYALFPYMNTYTVVQRNACVVIFGVDPNQQKHANIVYMFMFNTNFVHKFDSRKFEMENCLKCRRFDLTIF